MSRFGSLPPTEHRPRLLDAFCGAGGVTKGYQRAGFFVVGIDIKPQPNYCGDDFILGDALEVLDRLLAGEGVAAESGRVYHLTDFVAVHASPPCQGYSLANNIHGRDDHPMLIADVRERLEATGLPYVIENVEGAKRHMRDFVTLCGLSLGCDVRRHRLFETNFPVMAPPCGDHSGDWVLVFGHTVLERSGQVGRTENDGPIFRRKHLGTDRGREAMGIDWMNRDELSEAIPPAYTEHIGHYLVAHLDAEKVAA